MLKKPIATMDICLTKGIPMSEKTEPISEAVALAESKPDAITKSEYAPQSAKQTRAAAFTPTNLTEAIALAKLIANSGVCPKEFKGKVPDVLIAMQLGTEIGLAPLQALQGIAIINGRPTVWGDSALAVVQAHPAYEWHREEWEGQGDSRAAVCKVKRRGSEVHVRKFSVSDARKANLWSKAGPWQQYPDRMLQLRARGFALRDQFADALRGLSLAEEVMDIPVDNSPAKAQRDSATLDVGASIADLTPSAEANRGHNDTGLDQRSRTDEQSQAPAKADNVMCSECRQINSHAADCPVATKTEQDRRTSKPTVKQLYQVLAVKDGFKKGKGGVKGARYLILECVMPTEKGDVNGKLYIWHKTLHEFFPLGEFDKKLIAEVSEQVKDGKKYFQLDHIIELDRVPFVNDKPAVQGTLDVDPGPVPEEETWEAEDENQAGS